MPAEPTAGQLQTARDPDVLNALRSRVPEDAAVRQRQMEAFLRELIAEGTRR